MARRRRYSDPLTLSLPTSKTVTSFTSTGAPCFAHLLAIFLRILSCGPDWDGALLGHNTLPLLPCSTATSTAKKTMLKANSVSLVAAVAILIFGLSGSPLNAQQSIDPGKLNVVSANPFGLLLKFFNAEYERVISRTSTIGFGGSTISTESEMWDDPPIIGTDEYGYPIYDHSYDVSPRVENHRYVNFDVFWRFYPGSDRTRTYDAPVGWAFGAKIGVTAVDGGTYLGYGFDLNRSFVLGPNDNFYVGLGFGLKRLVGAPQDDLLELIPTIRIANVGFMF